MASMIRLTGLAATLCLFGLGVAVPLPMDPHRPRYGSTSSFNRGSETSRPRAQFVQELHRKQRHDREAQHHGAGGDYASSLPGQGADITVASYVQPYVPDYIGQGAVYPDYSSGQGHREGASSSAVDSSFHTPSIYIDGQQAYTGYNNALLPQETYNQLPPIQEHYEGQMQGYGQSMYDANVAHMYSHQTHNIENDQVHSPPKVPFVRRRKNHGFTLDDLVWDRRSAEEELRSEQGRGGSHEAVPGQEPSTCMDERHDDCTERISRAQDMEVRGSRGGERHRPISPSSQSDGSTAGLLLSQRKRG
ncbi:hypothetical protein CBS101457_000275 [Exobasidium rhododendri]|nr:hypothetical protein CBS101457_000275 [Exobasidium rhododendri]